ncbi:MAG: hypothetical protein KDB23_29275, partial [Planctomycetales bacterium]|nr:hypothetical protein [Planctomycetales bacterium]
EVSLPADASAISNLDLSLTVPVDVPVHDWAWTIRADLLGEDEQTVVATAYAPVERLETIEPLKLTIDDTERVVVPVGDNQSVTLSGTVVRHADYRVPVGVRLTGLPDGEPPVEIILPLESDTFELKIGYPTGTAAKEMANVRVEVTTQGGVPATARSKPFTLQIKP